MTITPDQQQRIDELLLLLTRATTPPDVTNQYAADATEPTTLAANAQRRTNLHRALTLAVAEPPELLLIAEAPGYRGARRTGVPFTSDDLLVRGVAPLNMFGTQHGFALAEHDGKLLREQTATIVWRTLAQLKVRAAGWNAYPFHPHRANQPHSNRPPRSSELRDGQSFLLQFRALFPTLPVLAMGNSAHRALTWLNIPHHKIRHPAQGGAQLFARGLQAFVATLPHPTP